MSAGRALAAALAAGLLLAVPVPAAALVTPRPLAGVRLTLALPAPTRAGGQAALSGRLVGPAGPLPRAAVHLFVDGRFALTLETSPGGWLRYDFSRDLPAGGHAIALLFHGSRPRGLAPAAAAGTLTILPLDLTLQAEPPLAGASFTVDGRTYVAGPDGAARATVAAIGLHAVAAAPPPPTGVARYAFARWFDGVTAPGRDLRVLDDLTVVATFSGAYRVSVSFRDGDGGPVDPRRVSDVSVRGPGGQTIQVTPLEGAVWLPVPGPPNEPAGAAPSPLRYALASARFDGVSVANHGDDSFVPAPGLAWTARLRVYALRARLRRPLLGAGRREVIARSRDGVERRAVAGADGVAVLRQLPRGLYSVSAVGAQAGMPASVRVTRDRQLDLASYTAGEVAAGAGAIALAAAGMLTLAVLARRRRPATAGPRPPGGLAEESE